MTISGLPKSTVPGDRLAADVEADVRRRYINLRGRMSAADAVTVLHVGAECSAVAAGAGADPASIIILAIGSKKTGRAFFRHDPPTPAEMENAIQAVEDEVIRARTVAPTGSVLVTTDAAARAIARLAGLPASGTATVIALESVEQVFGRLAAITLGRPAAQDEMPTDAAFAASLLILREFMHHLEFASITLEE